MRVLVLADTHLGPSTARSIVDVVGAERLGTADAIVHAGDLNCGEVIDELSHFGPVYAVLGNNDRDVELPERVEFDLDGSRIAVVHDSGPAKGRGARLAAWFPGAAVVVFGHSHLPWNESISLDGGRQHHFNPGSPTQRRRAPTRTIGWLSTGGDGIALHHEDL